MSCLAAGTEYLPLHSITLRCSVKLQLCVCCRGRMTQLVAEYFRSLDAGLIGISNVSEYELLIR